MAGGNRDAGRTVASKTLAILEAFESGRRSLTLQEIAEQANLPLSTAHRLAAELEEWGALSRDSQRRYQLGLRLWELSQHAGRALRDTARPYVQDLHNITGETSQLAIRDGRDSLFIHRFYGSRRIPRASRVGGRLPLHATAVGKVLLAKAPDELLEAYLDADLEQPTPHTHANPVQLRGELEQVRQQGFATSMDEIRVGSSSVAVPVFHTGRVGASIGIVTATTNLANLTKFLPALRAISERIEQATVHIPLETLLRTSSDIALRSYPHADRGNSSKLDSTERKQRE
ncbi:IclR family transcriptional regulator [Luteococcus sp. OSA5]|uniref:IclR family transcriptional regulator n=1 Tax=Luteococcus sp. OSA5 TaxID=3401630 RepID=UPI003B438F0E